MESVLLLDAWFSGGGRMNWKEEDRKLYNWETETTSPEAEEENSELGDQLKKEIRTCKSSVFLIGLLLEVEVEIKEM